MSPETEAQLAEVWEQEFDQALSVARKSLVDPTIAEDVAMAAFAKLGEILERRGDKNPRQLFGIILNQQLIDTARAHQRQPEEVSFDEHKTEPGLGTNGFYHDPTFAPEFDSAVRGLKGPEREVFILTELRGLTVREVEEVTGLSKSSAHRLDAAARNRIRKELAA